MRNNEDDFKFNLVSIYGLAQNEHKENFLYEVVHMCSKETLPIILGGDFNIIHGPDEKNNDRWPFLFNTIIDALNLRERNVM